MNNENDDKDKSENAHEKQVREEKEAWLGPQSFEEEEDDFENEDLAIDPISNYEPSEDLLNSLHVDFQDIFLDKRAHFDWSTWYQDFKKEYFTNQRPHLVKAVSDTLVNYVSYDQITYNVEYIFFPRAEKDQELFYFLLYMFEKYITNSKIEPDYIAGTIRLNDLGFFDFAEATFIHYGIELTSPNVFISETTATINYQIELDLKDILKNKH
jgi:hypothetical protein